MAKVMDFIRLLRGLTEEEQYLLEQAQSFLAKKQFKSVARMLKQRKIELSQGKVTIVDVDYPKIKALSSDVKAFTENTNETISRKIRELSLQTFSQNAFDKLQGYIAPNIVGMNAVKQAAVLQLFAPDHVHMLLLGDPGTGKTDILRSISDLYPVSSFGLGSGTSGCGLAVTVKGKEVQKGLLPLADNGICCIDELNLLKEENRASLYNAMEKGFITYNKGGHNYRFDARITVVATANPKGDKFDGDTVLKLKKQLPFDSALLTRFHMVFIVRKPDIEGFKKITSRIIKDKKHKVTKADVDFIKEYIKRSEALGDIKLPSTFEKQIVDFTADLKKKEKDYLVEISPRFVIGIVRLAKASARSELRKEVSGKDISRVKEILVKSLRIV